MTGYEVEICAALPFLMAELIISHHSAFVIRIFVNDISVIINIIIVNHS